MHLNCCGTSDVSMNMTFITIKLAPNKKTRNHLLRIPYDLRLKSVCLNWMWSVLHIHIQSLKPLLCVTYYCCCGCCCCCYSYYYFNLSRLESSCCRLYRIRIKESSLPMNANSHLLYSIRPWYESVSYDHSSFVSNICSFRLIRIINPTNSFTHTCLPACLASALIPFIFFLQHIYLKLFSYFFYYFFSSSSSSSSTIVFFYSGEYIKVFRLFYSYDYYFYIDCFERIWKREERERKKNDEIVVWKIQTNTHT